MSDTCPTVAIKADNEQGFAVINESDFDAKKGHDLFGVECFANGSFTPSIEGYALSEALRPIKSGSNVEAKPEAGAKPVKKSKADSA